MPVVSDQLANINQAGRELDDYYYDTEGIYITLNGDEDFTKISDLGDFEEWVYETCDDVKFSDFNHPGYEENDYEFMETEFMEAFFCKQNLLTYIKEKQLLINISNF